MRFRSILFDLDGTLTDPKEGITRSIQHALKRLDQPVPAADDLLWCIGPPLKSSLKKLLGADQKRLVDRALYIYRERYDDVGKYENEIYDQISDVLHGLVHYGMNLYLATAKPVVFATDIIGHFNLNRYFKGIYGSEWNGDRSDKAELIDYIMESEGLDRDSTLMVGDRLYDMAAAKKTGISALGVTYGYGSRSELLDSGADWIVDTPSDIKGLILENI